MAEGIYPVTVPKWGIEMQEGTIVAWHIQEGMRVNKGEALIDIETEKIINTLDTPADGVLRKRIVEEGETLNVGALLGVIADAGISDAEVDTFIAEFKPADAAFGDEDPGEPPTSTVSPANTAGSSKQETQSSYGEVKVKASPAAVRRAKELNVAISEVSATGKGGRISSEDVENYAQSHAGETDHDTTAYEAKPLSALRKSIARRLVQSKQQIPHFYLITEVAVAKALSRREKLNREWAGRISVNDIIVRAAILALGDCPQLNIHLVDDEVRQFKHINMAIAVATDDGLLTPVVHQSESLSIHALSEAISDLGVRARNNHLTSADLRGATFTVSNLGMYGITEFQAIINPPQGAILSIGRISKRYVPAGEGMQEIKIMKIGLSCDHRAIDGVLGAQFLAGLKTIIEDPVRI